MALTPQQKELIKTLLGSNAQKSPLVKEVIQKEEYDDWCNNFPNIIQINKQKERK